MLLGSMFVDPKPFGTPNKLVALPCRAVHVAPYAVSQGPEGFMTVLTIELETPEAVFRMSIDENSARFLAGALALYLPTPEGSNDPN